jgi:asparagine synthase (glutamine-hydrolysing)
MFTFAVWDTRRRELLLARDRLGIKPLYYACLPGGLAFGSELKAIVQLPEVERRLNWRALRHFVTFLATPPDESILEGVRKLEPAHTATFSGNGQLTLDRYWRVDFSPDAHLTETCASERLRELLDESVRLHLESDVPLGAFLSGGLDSSAVVEAMTRLQPGRVKTFSIGFADAAFDERPYAARVAHELGTEHHALLVEPQPAAVIESLVWYLDEPFGDCSAIPTMLVSKLAAEHVKVVLSGDGGDELFAG